jgi:hypothetical protein
LPAFVIPKDASFSAALTMFKEWSVFPPNSRPVDDSHEDIASPFTTASAELPLVRATNGRESTVLCALQPLRNVLTVGESLQVALSCRRPDPGGDPAESVNVRPTAGAIALERTSGGVSSPVPLGGQGFVDDGNGGDRVANDNVFTLSIPVTADMTGALSLSAQVSVAGADAQKSGGARTYTAAVTVTPVAPARFTGKVADRLSGGSLIVDVEIAVDVAGRYRLMANIESNGALVAYAKEDRDLTAGRQTVPLLFFGKILTDARIDGPLTVTNLRGTHVSLNSGTPEPAFEPLVPILVAHVTRSYTARDFSDAEWDSDYKRERLAELEALARRERATLAQGSGE